MKDQLSILLVDDDERICSSVHEALSSFSKLKFELTCHQSIFEIDQEPCLEKYDLALFNSNYLRQYSDEVSKIIGRMETVFPVLFLGDKEHEGYQDKNLHNQYIQNFSDLGIIGFALLLVILLFNIKNAIKNKDFVHFAFAILMISLFLTESFLWRQRGVVFFTLFYCLFNSNVLKDNPKN
jgi:hypothetical protein